MKRVLLYITVVVLLGFHVGWAQAPRTLSYQGVLHDGTGGAVPNGSYNLIFKIYNIGGTELWNSGTQTQSVNVEGGIFSVVLRDIGLPFDEPYWLGVAMAGQSEFNPRMELTTSPYSFSSKVAESADDVAWDNISGMPVGFSDGIDNVGDGVGDGHSLDAADGDPVDAVYVDNEGRVGIGTATPEYQLDVAETVKMAGFKMPTGASDGYVLVSDATGTGSWQPESAGIGGSGTAGQIPVFTGSETIANSQLFHTASYNGMVGVGTTPTDSKLHVHHFSVSIPPPTYLARFTTGLLQTDQAYIESDGDAYFRGQVYVGGPVIVGGVQIEGIGGHVVVPEIEISGGSDFAEPFEIKGADALEPGSVVVIDAARTGTLKISTEPYDKRVAGVISGAGGIKPGLTLSQEGLTEDGQNVALSGRVYVRASATNGAIHPGDLLTTSSMPGCAMKATDKDKTWGAVLGKAMSRLDDGEGLVLVLVSLQ